MAHKRSASLRKRYRKRVDVPVLLLASGGLILAGLLLPAFETRTLLLWRDEYSILLNVQALSQQDKHVAATILALCSVVYPALKFGMLAFFWLLAFPYRWRARVISLLRVFGRWAMVDVFTIVTVVLASLTVGPLEATPQIGLYLYAGGIICLMFVALQMDRLARYGRK